ncbi:hypothetical protein ABBQ38_014037 [Trebouxia sp. C0009 RCD-2024]
MQQQRLILSVSACITLVLLGVLVVLSKPLFQNKERPSNFSRSHSIGHEALQQYSKFHLTHLTPYFPAVPGFPAVLPGTASNLDEFIHELKPILDKQQLPSRAFNWIFDGKQLLTKPHPNCGGTWMEFGVFRGDTINAAADYRKMYCESNPPPIYGFDTFQGLPEQWGTHMEQGHFSLGGNFPEVRDNVELIQGLFNESLPPFINRHYKTREHHDITYLHIDCDLYHGAIDALMLLNPYLAPGCIVLFDDLVNYPDYREHEIRALWEWLQASKRELEVIGVKGPLPPVDGMNKTHAMEINPPFDLGWHHQSVAFIVL